MNTIKCPNCEHENKNTNIKCEVCGIKLNHVEQSNIFLIMIILKQMSKLSF